ncbi:hypothetical protein VIBNISFn27_p10099 [Vibrio nigripulchritudo SFn27]|uniref:Nucleotidyltransferase n=1 Tax=Vibrio nigripulchritudo TaxID=28173 RepID=A0A9P1JM07_9VIBR|nr:hypothetical protein [Vibrio nigripulchritudo]CBJ93129.1 Conserved hypothetical protein [Vibrio nigripulchritudo]CCN85944.1 hypothetical protein VIBNIBLFn1_p0090 [Vibrio nigripulchritudo BLFn1]CCN91941.1 hypothetical protein VIBNISFn27_p10099 [Vibrio nigripulchritudo SFn27]CCN97741.1 hypothetical protein VIBNIENn2_p0089 [Vibrio nigripulchritudo ENn2]CCO43975.1 hypothetical protein VIBNISFn135_p10099 [Vibrio nigripulchritudo SFn135]
MKYINLKTFLDNKSKSIESLEIFLKEMKVNSNSALTGSLVEGHGTMASDIDVNVITSTKEVVPVRNLYFDGIRIDIESIPETVLDKFILYLKEYDYEGSTTQFTFDIDTQYTNLELASFYGRCLNSTCCTWSTTVESKLETLQKNGLLKWLSSYYIWESEHHYEDATGYIGVGDNTSAYQSCITMLSNAYTGLLNSRGVFVDRPKWALYHLNNHCSKSFNFYSNFLNGATSNKNLRSALKEANEIVEECSRCR